MSMKRRDWLRAIGFALPSKLFNKNRLYSYALGAGNMDEGIKLPRKWGLIRCGGRNRNKNPECSQLLIVKRGQKSKKCPNCGTQRSLEGRRRDVLAWSDSQGRIRRAMGELKGSGKYRKLGDLDG